jgi:Mrp family chromosome partitioning ATPase
MVHAGAQGDEAAVVCALDLSPTQLRISGQIAVTPKRRGKTHPEMARLVDGRWWQNLESKGNSREIDGSKVVTVTSGKGGVGKTTATFNLALRFGK